MRANAQVSLTAVVLALLAGVGNPAWADVPWGITTLENGFAAGRYTSLVILPSGYPAISHHDDIDGDLEYTEFDPENPDNPNDDHWDTTTVDSAGSVGAYTSLALQTAGLNAGQPAISYYDATNQDLKYAWRDFAGLWHTETIDSTGNVGTWTSLAFQTAGPNVGQPAISYRDESNGDLKYAWRDAASYWHKSVVDNAGSTGFCTSLVFMVLSPLAGQPAIAYHNNSDGSLRLAWYDGYGWYTCIVEPTGDNEFASLQLIPCGALQGQLAIGYQDNSSASVKFAWHEGADLCANWQNTVVDTPDVGGWVSLKFLSCQTREAYYFGDRGQDLPGEPVLAYQGDGGGAKFAWHNGSDFHGNWKHTFVEDGELGSCTSLAILPSGEPALSYHRWDVDQLDYAWHDRFGWYTTAPQKSWKTGGYNDIAVQTSGPNAGQPIVCYSMNYPDYKLTVAERDPNHVWHKSTVTVGSWWVSLAILPSGQPAVAYEYEWSGELYGLNYYERDGSGVWHLTHVDSAATHISLAVSCSDQPMIAYACRDDLKVAWRDELGSWQFDIPDSEGKVGYWTSLAFFPPDHPAFPCQPAISYHKGDADLDLKFAWRDPNGVWSTTTVDAAGRFGESTSLVIFPMDHPTHPGQPAIGYNDRSNNDLRFTWHETGYDFSDPNNWRKLTVDNDVRVGWYTSLVVLPSGQPAMSYRDDYYNRLKYAWHEGNDLGDPNAWHKMIVDSAGDAYWTNLVVLPNGHPAISHHDGDHWDFKYAELLPGDMNCDGTVNYGDINPFVLAVAGQAAYEAQYPGCRWLNADCNGDGAVNYGDINAFVRLLAGR